MKNNIFALAITFSFFSVVFVSCSKDDTSSESTVPSAAYQLIMDGNVVAEGTSTNKVLMLDNTINIGGAGSDFVITITNVPEEIGGNIAVDLSSGVDGDNCQLIISGNNILESGADEIYWAKSGTVTRTSVSMINFLGTCQSDASGSVIYSFSGSVESDAFKIN